MVDFFQNRKKNDPLFKAFYIGIYLQNETPYYLIIRLSNFIMIFLDPGRHGLSV